MADSSSVNMDKVYCKPDAWGGMGAFARVPIAAGEVIEKGIVRVLPLDGNDCPFVFTWSEGEPRQWASGSGASVFYNMAEDPNTDMKRDFKNNSFEIVANRDIAADEELTHVYISATWRKCFTDLKPIAEAYIKKNPKGHKDLPAPSKPPAALPEGPVPGTVDMSKVYVKPDAWGGHGAFAKQAIKKGDLIERGIVRVLPVDGNESPFVFTWSEGEPRKWASGSGASVFYNMSEDPNTHMTRYFDEERFEIHAARDIEKDEELTHVYISATWRKCFEDLKPMAEAYLKKQEAAQGGGCSIL